MGATILQNEQEVEALAQALGLQMPVHFLGYRNHFLDEASTTELRARLVFLFRALKVDTVITFNPWAHGEENPDHYVTGQAVEAAKWMAGGDKDYPEHAAAGVAPYQVEDQYYLCSTVSPCCSSEGGYVTVHVSRGRMVNYYRALITDDMIWSRSTWVAVQSSGRYQPLHYAKSRGDGAEQSASGCRRHLPVACHIYRAVVALTMRKHALCQHTLAKHSS